MQHNDSRPFGLEIADIIIWRVCVVPEGSIVLLRDEVNEGHSYGDLAMVSAGDDMRASANSQLIKDLSLRAGATAIPP